MKVVAIKVLGSEREPLDLELSPGMTAKDLLEGANLAGYLLVRQGEQYYFHPEEAIYDKVHDGDKLYACTTATVEPFRGEEPE